jgi:hypothetical protein
MSILPLTRDNFDTAVAQSACLVIEFSNSAEDFADRAGRVMDSNGVEWGHVDMRTEARLAASFGIETDVALLIFREQIVLYLEGGKHDPAQMADLVSRVCALDMRVIKAEIEAQKQAELALRMRRVCPTARRGPMGG